VATKYFLFTLLHWTIGCSLITVFLYWPSLIQLYSFINEVMKLPSRKCLPQTVPFYHHGLNFSQEFKLSADNIWPVYTDTLFGISAAISCWRISWCKCGSVVQQSPGNCTTTIQHQQRCPTATIRYTLLIKKTNDSNQFNSTVSVKCMSTTWSVTRLVWWDTLQWKFSQQIHWVFPAYRSNESSRASLKSLQVTFNRISKDKVLNTCSWVVCLKFFLLKVLRMFFGIVWHPTALLDLSPTYGC
jgi:hypothetical protein